MEDRRKIIVAAAALGVVLIALGSILYWKFTCAPKKKAVVYKRAVVKEVVKKRELPAVQKKYANPKVAIVIDDFGYSMKWMDELFAPRLPVTLSILPNLRYSRRIAQLAHSKGCEVILHLPMEATDKTVPEELDTIKTGMDEKKVASMLDQEISQIPYLKGVSNHQGSKATEDNATMSVVIGELKKKGLYFFDSFCTSKSVCREAARAAGVPYARRDMFLDDVNTPESVEKELLSLRKLAFRKGKAIAVCHDRKVTIAVLSKMMPLLADDGIVFVYLSEMVN
jgi:polysaccharide deacetylase 2 family uncharacterized protein YibQ